MNEGKGVENQKSQKSEKRARRAERVRKEPEEPKDSRSPKETTGSSVRKIGIGMKVLEDARNEADKKLKLWTD